MPDSPVPPPGEYLGAAFQIIANASLKRSEVDMTALELLVAARASELESVADAHAAIKDILSQLNDNHSFLLTAEQAQFTPAPDSAGWRLHWEKPVIIDVTAGGPADRAGVRPGDLLCEVNGQPVSGDNWHSHFRNALAAGAPLVVEKPDGTVNRLNLERGFKQVPSQPQIRMANDSIGLLDLPGHLGDGSFPDGTNYGSIVRNGLQELEAAGVSSWVVDLRRCDGGNMWPILAGLTPLLGTGTYGYFVDPIADKWWGWQFDGKNLASVAPDSDETYIMANVPNWSPLELPDVRVAVLTSRVTSSSGEAVTIAFTGREDTKFFGEPTGGLTSANNRHVLADGAELYLAETFGADRLRRIYESGIAPDELLVVDWANLGTTQDLALSAALRWLTAKA